MNELTKLLTLLRLLLAHIDVSDFLTVILGLVVTAEIPADTKQQLTDGLNEMLGRID